MINRCTEIIINWLINCEAIEETDRSLYEYALYSIFLTISPVFLVVLLGNIFGFLRESFLIIIPFFILRKYCGGYHTKKAWLCIIESSLLLILCIFISSIIKCNNLLLIFTIYSMISLGYFSPMDNENKILRSEERNAYKKNTVIVLLILGIIELILLYLKMNIEVKCISMGIMLTAFMQYPSIVIKAKNAQK